MLTVHLSEWHDEVLHLPLHLAWDMNCPFVQHILSVSHLAAIFIIN